MSSQASLKPIAIEVDLGTTAFIGLPTAMASDSWQAPFGTFTMVGIATCSHASQPYNLCNLLHQNLRDCH